MRIYSLEANYTDFQILIHSEEKYFIKDRKGDFIEDWEIPTWKLFNKTKKDLKRRTDFNANNYFSALLIMEENLAKKMLSDLEIKAQLLPVNTPEFEHQFVYVNILDSVDTYTDGHLSYEEQIEKWESGNMSFKSDPIGNCSIFRDKKLSTVYFCTEKFIQWATDNDVRGLKFKKEGEAF